MVREITLTKGFVALVDDEDHERVAAHRWRTLDVRGGPYAVRSAHGRIVYMHRVIVGAALGEKVDHRDDDGLNNTRSNLRSATTSQNGMNRGTPGNNTSGFKGVVFDPRCHLPFRAQITVNGKYLYLDTYATPEEAARAYDDAAREHHGEFASTNFTDHEWQAQPHQIEPTPIRQFVKRKTSA